MHAVTMGVASSSSVFSGGGGRNGPNVLRLGSTVVLVQLPSTE